LDWYRTPLGQGGRQSPDGFCTPLDGGSKAINAASFTSSDIDFAGPDGTVGISSVQPVVNNTYRVNFASLSVRGTYNVAIGPEIEDVDGNKMDQNQNGTNGDPDTDIFATSVRYVVADVIFDTDMVIAENNATYDGRDILIDGATVTIDGAHNFNSVHIISNATLTHPANTTDQTHKLDLTVAEQVIVDGTSRIDVSAKGYLPGRTTGNTTECGATGVAGGSYGGLAGARADSATNVSYGDYADPDDWGSGGSNQAGGGLLRLTAQTLQLDGRLEANGDSDPSRRSDGGSGGWIAIVIATLRGDGFISAAGGDGWSTTSVGSGGAGGGGGRIALYAQDYSQFDLSHVSASGGQTERGDQNAQFTDGGAGTVHIVQGKPHTHIRSYQPVGKNGGCIKELDHVAFTSNKELDVRLLSADDVECRGPLGPIVPTAFAMVGDRTYQIDFAPQTENGYYRFTLFPTIIARIIHEVRREGPQVETDARKRAICLRNILLIREHRRIVL